MFLLGSAVKVEAHVSCVRWNENKGAYILHRLPGGGFCEAISNPLVPKGLNVNKRWLDV